MKKIELGKTGQMVSTFCFGAMYLGTRQENEAAFSLLDQFTEAGGDFIDTANIYAHWTPNGNGGDSEKCIGQWIRNRKNRQSIFIASKVGFPYQDVPGSSKAHIIVEECNKSLKRLGVETIDLYYAHTDDRNTPVEEQLEAFHKLIKAGKVRYIGASNHSAWRLEESFCVGKRNNWPVYQCVQQRHTYIRKIPGTTFAPQMAVNDDLLDYCRNREITLLAYSPLLSGAYTREDRQFDKRYLGVDTGNRIAVLRSVAKETNATLNQVILAWMLGSNPLVVPIIAGSTKDQMKENLAASDIELSEEQMKRLDTAGAQ
jgi:aryl-alcohol dehydrogenase-like predicted oxidoreductase